MIAKSSREVEKMQRTLLFVAVLSALFPVADGCSSRPWREKAPVTEFGACSAPFRHAYCLNGGACFNYTIGHLHLPACRCAEGFMGERCELKYLQQRRLAAIPTLLGVFVSVVVLIGVLSVCRIPKEHR